LSEKAKEEHLLKELQMRDERLAQLEALVAQLQASSQQQTAKPGKPKEN
jgi:hypothetical protein